MENKFQPQNASPNGAAEQPQPAPPKNNSMLAASIFVSAFMLAGAWVYTARLRNLPPDASGTAAALNTVDIHGDATRNPQQGGAVLPVRWDDLGKRLVETGVIDAE